MGSGWCSFAVINTMTISHSGGDIYITSQPTVLYKGNSEQELRTGIGVRFKKRCGGHWAHGLAPNVFLNLLSYTTQDHHLGGNTGPSLVFSPMLVKTTTCRLLLRCSSLRQVERKKKTIRTSKKRKEMELYVGGGRKHKTLA